MRKIYLLLLLVLVIAASCKKKSATPDSDDGIPPAEAKTLPASIIMTSNGETKTYTISYVENSTKIDKISSSQGRVDFYIYEGDFITKKYEGNKSSDHYDAYSYANNKLMKEESFRGGKLSDMVEFSYSGAKTQALFKEYHNNNWQETVKLQFSYDAKGNLSAAEMSEQGTAMGAATVSYDSNNSPFMNVSGWGIIKFVGGLPLGDNIDFEDIISVRNNPMKLTGTMMGDNVEVIYSYEFKDSKNPKFPTKITGKKTQGTQNATFMAEITYK